MSIYQCKYLEIFFCPMIPSFQNLASISSILQMTKALANEWAQYGITVKAIGPGYCFTEMTHPLLSKRGVKDKYEEPIPMDRIGKPEDMTTTAIYLASDVSCYVIGQMIYVDGGWTIN